MPRRQAKATPKVIYKAAHSKKAKHHFSKYLVTLTITVALACISALMGIEILKTTPATANQSPSLAKTPVLFASNLMMSPTPTPELPLPIIQAEESDTIETASETVKLELAYAPDYCLDVPVLMYHHVQPMKMANLLGHGVLTADSELFDEQIHYLKENGYTALAAQDLADALRNRTQLPEKSIIITIDDGYDDNYTYAFMTAKKYQFIMNFMIPTGLIDTPGYMKWEHLSEMNQNPYAKIYNHTTGHTALGLITKDQIITEVTQANSDLHANLGLKNDIVTYPYGSYDDEAMNTLKELNMTAAFTTDHGRLHCLSTIMRLPRIRIGNAPMSEYGF